MSTANVLETSWSGLPQYVCLRCGASVVGLVRGKPRMIDHMQAIHGETPEPLPPEEPPDMPDDAPETEPVEEPTEEPNEEAVEVV